ncbi:MAG: DUF885 family protein, partial [Thermoanaerobaculia bacterium]|nr:DUF885 family protein [Thermoanaerobaculia bacterium]
MKLRACLVLTALTFGLVSWLPAAEEPADAAERLDALFEEEWETRLREFPLTATAAGVHEYDDRLGSMAPEALERRHEIWKSLLDRLEAIDPEGLDEEDRISRAMMERILQDRIAEYRFGGHQIPLTADSGFHTAFARLPAEMPFRTTEQYENYLSRLREFPRWVGEHVELMRTG